MKFETLRNLAALAAKHDRPGAERAALIAEIGRILETETGPAWRRDFGKLADFLRDGIPRFSIIAKGGNSKLPFLAFSAMPGADYCPGAGECLQFCYSFRAWRYPAAFCRQLQNSILLNSVRGRDHIAAAIDKLKPRDGSRRDFRLYVDGDFRTAGEVRYWFELIAARPWIRAYGYSKSWEEILQHARRGGTLPENYRLNLSSGSRHGAETRAEIAALDITRGEFIAVPIGRAVKSTDHGTRDHNRELRAAYQKGGGGKAFTCPGKCGTCTPAGHACGLSKFTGIPIIIAAH